MNLSSANKSANSSNRTRWRNLYQRVRHPEQFLLANKTPWQTIYQRDIFTVRHYLPLKTQSIRTDGVEVPVQQATQKTPLVLVAPLAVNMLIYDLFPERSLAKFLRAQGFELYLIDWGSPEQRHNELHLEDYFGDFLPRMIDAICQHSGSEQVSLHGWSFGGLFSYSYAILHPERVKNLVLLGAPFDYHNNGNLGKVYQGISWAGKALDKLGRNPMPAIPKSLLGTSGLANSLMFKVTDPIGNLRGYWNLWQKLDDADYVAQHTTQGAFIDNMEAYPGGVVQDIIEYLWVESCLPQDRLPVRTLTAPSVSTLNKPMLLITGKQDPIVAAECSLPLLAVNRHLDKTHLPIKGGHMSIVSGKSAAHESWWEIANWLKARD